jgi:hypothetical protein
MDQVKARPIVVRMAFGATSSGFILSHKGEMKPLPLIKTFADIPVTFKTIKCRRAYSGIMTIGAVYRTVQIFMGF